MKQSRNCRPYCIPLSSMKMVIQSTGTPLEGVQEYFKHNFPWFLLWHAACTVQGQPLFNALGSTFCSKFIPPVHVWLPHICMYLCILPTQLCCMKERFYRWRYNAKDDLHWDFIWVYEQPRYGSWKWNWGTKIIELGMWHHICMKKSRSLCTRCSELLLDYYFTNIHTWF